MIASKLKNDSVDFIHSSVSQVFSKLNMQSELEIWNKFGQITKTAEDNFHICLPLSIDMSPTTLKNHLSFITGVNITIS